MDQISNLQSDVYLEIGTSARLTEQGYLNEKESNQKQNALDGRIRVHIGSELAGQVEYSGLSIWLNRFRGNTISIEGDVKCNIYLGVAEVDVDKMSIKNIIAVESLGKQRVSKTFKINDLIPAKYFQ